MLRKTYLVNKVQSKPFFHYKNYLVNFSTVQLQIQDWYKNSDEKVKIQSRVPEYQECEQTRIYHHELHQKKIKWASILKLQIEDGLIEGHESCSKYLEKQVEILILSPAVFCLKSQESLLNELEPFVTASENEALSKSLIL